MASNIDEKRPSALHIHPSRSSSTDSSSSTSSLKSPRVARFAEATAVHSPVVGRENPFSDKAEVPHAKVSDVGFGYISNESHRESVAVPMTPRSPLKSAMKVPGTARRLENPLSPTFREEDILEEREKLTEKEQARDLKIKTRVRMAKFALRGVNFSCSLIVLSMMSASFAIFNATKSLPAESNLPAWSVTTSSTDWPQKLAVAASCLTLTISIGVFIGYCRGGHKRAEKVGVYYTLFAIAWFIFSMVMWAFTAGIFTYHKNNSNGQDMWGWACKGDDNVRHNDFEDKVNYALVCQLQNWGLVCALIEVVIEVISISLYSFIFYRYYTKRKLHKSMDMRDKARSDLYLAQLRVQSAPNTPGFGPKSPSFSQYGLKSPAFSQYGPKSPAFSQYALSPRFPPQTYRSLGDIEEGASPFTPGGQRLIVPESAFTRQRQEKPFKLQAPPTKANPATPKSPTTGLKTPTTPAAPPAPAATVSDHGPVAPGEQQYDAVPIPGAYNDAAVKQPGAAYIR